MVLLKRLNLCFLVLLFACAHQDPVQTGVYFYKGYIDQPLNEGGIIADFTFEITPSVCELVVSANGVNESYLCTVNNHRNHSISVYFKLYRSDSSSSLLNGHSLEVGEKMFTLSLQQDRYITDWEGFYPSQQNARSGMYFAHTYQK